MGKDKVEGKKGILRNFVDSGHYSRNFFNDKQDNVTADSDGTCAKQGSASASSLQHETCVKMLEGSLRR